MRRFSPFSGEVAGGLRAAHAGAYAAAPRARACGSDAGLAFLLLALCSTCSPTPDSNGALSDDATSSHTASGQLGIGGLLNLNSQTSGGETGRVDAGTSSGGLSGTGSICNATATPESALVQSCVLGNACDPLVPQFTLSMCITYDTPTGCASRAEDCSDMAKCNKRQWEPDSACSRGESGWKCAGARAIQCGDERPWSVDCGSLGGTCLLYTGSQTDPTWPCWIEAPSGCDGAPDVFACSGDIRYTCRDGLTYGVDCSQVGLSCIEDAAGEAYCGTVRSSCDEPSTSSCVDNAVELCSASGLAFSYDCSRGSGACKTDGSQEWYCPARGCSPEDELQCVEECLDSRVMKVCVGGAPYHIDCADYGFSKCVLYSGPMDDSTYVGCR